MKRVSSLLMLWVTVILGFIGLGLFKGFFLELSIIDFSFNGLLSIVLLLVGGSFFVAAACWVGFFAFKKMRGS